MRVKQMTAYNQAFTCSAKLWPLNFIYIIITGRLRLFSRMADSVAGRSIQCWLGNRLVYHLPARLSAGWSAWLFYQLVTSWLCFWPGQGPSRSFSASVRCLSL